MYKTSFNGLSVSVKGVYSAYNLSQNEYESLKRAVGADNINGSNGNYTVFQNAKRQVLLKLYIHDFWTPVAFDIRSDLLKLYKSNRIYEEKIMDLSKKLKKMRIQLHVEYNPKIQKWEIIDYPGFLRILEELISEQQEKSTG